MRRKQNPESSVSQISRADLEAGFESVTLRTTDKVRALALGVLALTWAVLSADKTPISEIARKFHVWLLVAAFLAIVSLFIDLLHSLADYLLYDRLLDYLEAHHKDSGEFDPSSLLYKFGRMAFWIKVASCAISCILLLALIAVSL